MAWRLPRRQTCGRQKSEIGSQKSPFWIGGLRKASGYPFEGSADFTAVKNPQICKVIVWVEDAETGAKVIDETACEPLKS